MAILNKLLTTAALLGLAAAPAAAQYQYPQQSYPQQSYPQQSYPAPGQQYPEQSYPQQTYPQQSYPEQSYPQQYGQQGYAYPNQPYGTTESTINAIVDSLIGNRYAVSDRQAIHNCAWAAVQRAQTYRPYSRYGGYPGYPGYGQGYGYGYRGYNNVRVTAITNVERHSSGMRIHGVLDTGMYGNRPYDPRYGYGGGYGYGAGNLSFRCDVDYRGAVYDVRLDRMYRSY